MDIPVTVTTGDPDIMVSKQMQLRSALTQAIREFFAHQALYSHELQIQGTLCITADRNAIFVTQITETIQDQGGVESEPQVESAHSPQPLTLATPKLEALSSCSRVLPPVGPTSAAPPPQQDTLSSPNQRSPGGQQGESNCSSATCSRRSPPSSPNTTPAKCSSPPPPAGWSPEPVDTSSHEHDGPDLAAKRRCVIKQEVPDETWDSQDAHQWRSKLLRMLGSRGSPPPWPPESQGDGPPNSTPTSGPDGPPCIQATLGGSLESVPGLSAEQLDALASEVPAGCIPPNMHLDENTNQFGAAWGNNWMRKPKTKFSATQLQALDQEYRNDPFLSTCANKRAMLARALGLTEKNIQIWFQNQRRRRRAAAYSRMHHLFPSQRSPDGSHSPPPPFQSPPGPEPVTPVVSSPLSNGLVPASPSQSAAPGNNQPPSNNQPPAVTDSSQAKTSTDPPDNKPE